MESISFFDRAPYKLNLYSCLGNAYTGYLSEGTREGTRGKQDRSGNLPQFLEKYYIL
jgi:hypothetical protein